MDYTIAEALIAIAIIIVTWVTTTFILMFTSWLRRLRRSRAADPTNDLFSDDLIRMRGQLLKLEAELKQLERRLKHSKNLKGGN
jgi:erythromycin esterase-like protein